MIRFTLGFWLVMSTPNSPAEVRRLYVGPVPEESRSWPMTPKALLVCENLRIWASTDGELHEGESAELVLFRWRFSFLERTSEAGSGI